LRPPVSSVDPARWDEVIAAYGAAGGLAEVLLAAVQGLLSLAGTAAGSAEAAAWIGRLEAAFHHLTSAQKPRARQDRSCIRSVPPRQVRNVPTQANAHISQICMFLVWTGLKPM
jgi:hypothetical protein